MPGIFSWKNRILGRKTPEPERAKHVTVVSEPLDMDLHNQAPRRSVRFNDTRNKFGQYNVSEWQNEYGEVRLIGSVAHNNNSEISGMEKCEQPSSNWRYAESSVIADEPPPAQHYSTQVSTKAGHALQLLRERVSFSHEARRTTTFPPVAARPVTPVMSIPSEYGMNSSNRWEVVRKEQLNGDFGSMGRRLEQMNVVFLQANDEVKRTILPPEVSLEQVKMAFVRAFPNIPRHYIEQPSVKIYIQEPSKGQLFYELDDPSDIRNKSVLKLRDHTNTGMQSPVRFLDQRDFLADFESDISRQRCLPQTRPASAMAHSDCRKISHKPYDPYDSTGSDTSNNDSRCPTRSGSATPVIDRESRVRMETMERQLAGLSSLVHSALVSKGMSESNRKHMADLRREIMALHTDSERAASEEPPSLPDSVSTHAQHQLEHIRHKLQQASTDMKQLRRTAQVNAQHARNYIREAAEEIIRLVNRKVSLTVSPTEALLARSDTSFLTLRLWSQSFRKFENNVETVRNSVLTSNRKLKMSEVELLTEGLTQIGREAASLKTDFPSIQAGIQSRIKTDMERIVREEKYIRDQTAVIDQSLRRCKALANIMVTMKKLALVQDTTIHRSKMLKYENALEKQTVLQTGSSATAVTPLPPPVPPPPSSPPAPPTPPTPPKNPGLYSANFSSSINHNHVENDSAPATPLTEDYENMEMMVPNGAPPPPSRYSVQDVHQKFQKPPELADQIKNLIDEVARRPSPTPEANERRMDLERRQERLAEKQRQLRSQFQQLKQMTPLP
ncbi:unnamed protein product [Angiostrongylus costaricensis]|uniref:AIP3 domain-containing protein n=1 Tax=Angiostrongylus costaricensis TaxID=334426 RepID=A0A0R3PRV6_ANGCS|nr:unnamed protein product [Angiostrongylus costaricensis]